jgi:hypothetical protein
MNSMTLSIGRRFRATVQSFEAASKLYAEKRNASGEGGSTWPEGRIIQNDKLIARVSYNSRIWPAEEWTTEQKPLFVPACHHCGGTPCCCEVKS